MYLNKQEIQSIVSTIQSEFRKVQDYIHKNKEEVILKFTEYKVKEITFLSFDSQNIFIEFKTKDDTYFCKITWKDYLEYLNERINNE